MTLAGEAGVRLYRDFLTQEEIDEQYEIERTVPDMAPYVDFYVGNSAQARESLSCTLDVPFGATREETLDIFPASQSNAPVLVFIHGGYWRALSSKEFSLVALGPVARGWTVVVMNYTLCPKVSIPEITRQSRAAVKWVYQNISQYNGDPNRIVVSGHSAGGQQTGMLLSTAWEADYGMPAEPLKGAIAVSGLFDLRPLKYSFVQALVQLNEESIQSDSPLFHVSANKTPVLVTVGGDEPQEFRRQSSEYYEKWIAAGNTGEHWEQDGKNHFMAIDGFADPQSPLCERLQAFVE